MDPSAVFEKSSKGVAHLQERSLRLPPMARSALIMIDGIKSAGEVAQRLGQADKIAELLAPLVENELIQRKGRFSAADDKTVAVRDALEPSAARPASVALTGDTGVIAWSRLAPQQVADTRRFMSKFVESKIGMQSEPFCMRIEGTKTGEQLGVELDRLAKVFSEGRNKAWVDELRQLLAARVNG